MGVDWSCVEIYNNKDISLKSKVEEIIELELSLGIIIKFVQAAGKCIISCDSLMHAEHLSSTNHCLIFSS